MVRKSVVSGALMIMSAMLLTGCAEPLTKLTAKQESEVINYAAHAVATHNKGQAGGYKPLTQEQIERYYRQYGGKDPAKDQDSDDVQTEEDKDESTTDTDTSTDTKDNESVENTSEYTTLTKALGLKSIAAKYKGYEICKNYGDDDVSLMSAENGKKYLILKIQLNNKSGQKKTCNLLEKNYRYSLLLNKKDTANAYATLLTKDLSTYDDTIGGGKKVSCVLVFSFSNEQLDKIDTMELSISDGEESRTVLLD